MWAGSEGEVLPAVRPLNVQAIRIGKNVWISIGWTEAKEDSLAFADFFARHTEVVCGQLINKGGRGLVSKLLPLAVG